VTVSPTPLVSISNQTICAGNSATLQAIGTPPGGSYSWSNGNTGSSITVNPSTTTTYTVTYTVNGCSAIQPGIVTVNQSPVVTASSATICSGGTATLTVTANQPGGTFSWSTGATGSSISVSPVSTTNYTVNYVLNGCTSSPVSSQVVVNSAPTVTVNNTTICAGNTATLTATPSVTGGTYLWSSGSTNQVIIVTPTATTNYTITYTASGCTPVTATGTVTVSPTPLVSISNQTICAGNSATLQAIGTPPGGSYSWSNGNTGSSITVNPTATTTYTVAYTVNGCSATQQGIVTVNQSPVVTATSATICSGGTATLTATANQPGGVFTWSTGATGSSISVSPTSTTNYTVSYAVNGCTSSLVSSQVVVNPTPTVTVNNSTICAGNSATLTATPSVAGGTYLWSSGLTNQVIIVSPTTVTTYTVTYTAIGCPPVTAAGIVTVNANPTVSLGSDTTLCEADFPYVLNASVTGLNNQFTWNTGEQTQSISITTGGTFTVNVSNSNGCTASDVIQITSDPCASLDDLNELTITIYPNPSADFVSIESNQEIKRFFLYDSNGKLVYSNSNSSNSCTIDISKWVIGVYELKLESTNSIVWKKLIKL
jgi:hypothetical protein